MTNAIREANGFASGFPDWDPGEDDCYNDYVIVTGDWRQPHTVAALESMPYGMHITTEAALTRGCNEGR